jgi:membrane protein required for beta-lactamase induction
LPGLTLRKVVLVWLLKMFLLERGLAQMIVGRWFQWLLRMNFLRRLEQGELLRWLLLPVRVLLFVALAVSNLQEAQLAALG